MRAYRSRSTSDTPSLASTEMLTAVRDGHIVETHHPRLGVVPCWTTRAAGCGWVRLGERAVEADPDTPGPVWIGQADTRVLDRLIADGRIRHTRRGYRTAPSSKGAC
ncbi:hypothetical protein SAMN04487819_11692 [Actinopolyspora alba]|uniref:Uncharacterized protein n=1 Tax=Actinopolyspora alba TaxID=673379 RepID=A0A1I2BGJ3_9ACTN|nr:hypothetical protein [Actinopolyspora alba]SFE55246.1 hypothetical protein SAMN04487819_11692 [Actinopolyspora alba]